MSLAHLTQRLGTVRYGSTAVNDSLLKSRTRLLIKSSWFENFSLSLLK